ncbi:MAG: HPr family phosphocarrier protein [Spirochaetaceae bacterium]|jgi:phosphocarrier protein|nr:HPr family phosphocarrier protein [Spirochaetaceae bacterium]
MKQFEYTIVDPNGIHARPAGTLAAKIQEFESAVSLSCGDRRADGKKLIAIMKMRVKKGEKLTITAEGPDEDVAIEAVKEFISANL